MSEFQQRHLTPAPPDRLRRGDAAAIWQKKWFSELVVLFKSAAGEPYRWLALAGSEFGLFLS